MPYYRKLPLYVRLYVDRKAIISLNRRVKQVLQINDLHQSIASEGLHFLSTISHDRQCAWIKHKVKEYFVGVSYLSLDLQHLDSRCHHSLVKARMHECKHSVKKWA